MAVKIKIGASVDGSANDVFKPLEEAAKKARKTVANEMTGMSRAAKRAEAETEAAFAKLAREVQGIETPLDKSIAAVKQFGTEAKTSFAVARSSFNDFARDAEKNMREMERMAKQPSAMAQFSQKYVTGVSARGTVGAGRLVGRVGMGALRAGARVGGEALRSIAGGIGVNTDVGSMFGANADLETKATQLSNAAFMPGQSGAAGRRQNPQTLIAEARSVANETAMSSQDAIAGLQEFVGKTGDLDTGRKILLDMAKLSKATGTNMSDMVSAAGDVSNQLEDTPDKAEVLNTIMRQIAGQGKLGAVEIKDMATQMAKIAAGARLFEGGAANNIGILGAMAQEARQRGGAAGATQAATAVTGFTNVFSKNARQDAFRDFGVKTTGVGGKIRDPREILVDAMNASMKRGGSGQFNLNMGKMIADVSARRATRGFESVFQETYTKATGTEQQRLAEASAAVRAEFDRLTSVAMANKEIQDSFAKQMNTTQSKVQLFNNQMQDTAAEIQGALLPALIALAPAFIGLARGIAVVVGGITGTGGLDAGKETAEASLSATNAVSQTSGALRGAYGSEIDKKTGKSVALVPEGMQENLKEQRASLSKALAEKEQEAADARAAATPDTQAAMAAGGIKAGFMTTEERLEHSGQVESERRSTAQQLQAIVDSQTRLTEALLNGSAKVHVTNQTPPAPNGPKKPASGMAVEAETGQ